MTQDPHYNVRKGQRENKIQRRQKKGSNRDKPEINETTQERINQRQRWARMRYTDTPLTRSSRERKQNKTKRGDTQTIVSKRMRGYRNLKGQKRIS